MYALDSAEIQLMPWPESTQAPLAELDFETEMARPNAVQLSNLTAAWQIRENFSAKPWRPPFRTLPRKNLALPQEKTRLGFARSSPQRNRIQLMLRPGLVRATELKRLTYLRISPRTARRSGRAVCAHA